MLSDVVICYWSCDFLSSRNLTGLPSFLGFLLYPSARTACGNGAAGVRTLLGMAARYLWMTSEVRKVQGIHNEGGELKKNQLRDTALALTGFWMISLYLYLFLTSFVPCFGADSKICSNLLKRKQTVSNPVLVMKTFAMLRTPPSFLFQGHCLRQGNFHYASRDAGTTWDAWVSTAVTRRTAVEPMSLLAITTCRSQCSSSLEILLYAAVQYDPRR